MQFNRYSFLLLFLILTSCSQLEKAEGLITGLSEKEKYQKENNISEELFEIWESQLEKALKDSLEIELPYLESGNFLPRNFAIYSYQTYLVPGEVIQVKAVTDTASTLVFSELYKRTGTSGNFEKIRPGNAGKKELQFEIQESGLYKLVIQPEIEANTAFKIEIEKTPAYLFPVLDGKNSDIGSYWGDMRDGGKRDHKGIDIFAKKGTPVIAATEGKIKFTGEKGLGGKQIWLRDRKRQQSLYYAHLDSIIPGLNKVKAGDTIGFVGNTGNARTTPPHLHFGIYRSRQGALDPLGFVYLPEDITKTEPNTREISSRIKVDRAMASLRNKPASSNSKVIKTGRRGEIFYVQGKTQDWFHVRDNLNRSMYIHESLVKSVY